MKHIIGNCGGNKLKMRSVSSCGCHALPLVCILLLVLSLPFFLFIPHGR